MLESIESDIELGENAGVSAEGRHLVEELFQLQDSAWGPMLASLEDDEELHSVLTRLRNIFSKARERRDRLYSPVRRFGHRAFFDFATGWLVVELQFIKGSGESFEVRHDLEDTLRLGASVIESVAEAMDNLDALSVDAKRRCIGPEFEENLKSASTGLDRIRRALGAIRK